MSDRLNLVSSNTLGCDATIKQELILDDENWNTNHEGSPVGSTFSVKTELEDDQGLECKPFLSVIVSPEGIKEEAYGDREIVQGGGEMKIEDQFKCDVCGERFSELFLLKLHQGVHAQNGMHVCHLCNKTFPKLSRLQIHSRLHTGERPYACDECGSRFAELSVLRNHKSIHSGIRAHQCEVCQKRFTKSSSLKNHILIHSGIKPFTCEVCSRSFTELSSLRKHKRIHARRKPVVCDLCHRKFTSLSGLLQHNRSEHEVVKPYECTFCKERFPSVPSLFVHTAIHTGEEPYDGAVEQNASLLIQSQRNVTRTAGLEGAFRATLHARLNAILHDSG